MITKTLPSNIAKEGDTVIIYEDYKTSKIMKLVSNTHFDNRFGRFSHNDIIGKEFGSKVKIIVLLSSSHQDKLKKWLHLFFEAKSYTYHSITSSQNTNIVQRGHFSNYTKA